MNERMSPAEQTASQALNPNSPAAIHERFRSDGLAPKSAESETENVEQRKPMNEFIIGVLKDYFYEKYADAFSQAESDDRRNNPGRREILFSEFSALAVARRAVETLQEMDITDFDKVKSADIGMNVNFYRDDKRSDGWAYETTSYLLINGNKVELRP